MKKDKLDAIIEDTEIKRIPFEYIENFIVYDEDDCSYLLSPDEFIDLFSLISKESNDTGNIGSVRFSFDLDYPKLKKDIKQTTKKLLGQK